MRVHYQPDRRIRPVRWARVGLCCMAGLGAGLAAIVAHELVALALWLDPDSPRRVPLPKETA